MAVQLKLSDEDLEKYTSVSGLTTAEISRTALAIAGGLRNAASTWGVAAVGVGGEAVVAGSTIVGTSVVTGGMASGAMLASGIVLPILGGIALIASLGIPVAQAKQMAREKNLKGGFAVGCAIGVLGYGKGMVADFVVRTSDVGFAPIYMKGVSQMAFNIGLVIGYSASIQLSNSEKEKYRNVLTERMTSQASREGRKLFMQGWTDRTWVYNYSRAFAGHGG